MKTFMKDVLFGRKTLYAALSALYYGFSHPLSIDEVLAYAKRHPEIQKATLTTELFDREDDVLTAVYVDVYINPVFIFSRKDGKSSKKVSTHDLRSNHTIESYIEAAKQKASEIGLPLLVDEDKIRKDAQFVQEHYEREINRHSQQA